MDSGWILVVITAVLVVITAFYAWSTYRILEANKGAVEQMKEQNRALRAGTAAQVLSSLLQRYWSVEMFRAVRRLWTLQKQAAQQGQPVPALYTTIQTREEASMSALPAAEQVAATEGSLHYQRRSVSHFYQLLVGLRELGDVITDVVLYSYFSTADLEILEKVVIPVEKWLANEAGTADTAAHKRMIAALTRLYEDSKNLA